MRCDVAVIGCGPVGLFCAFELGLQELSAVMLDALPGPGGQCAALYPDKTIHDVPGLPRVHAETLTQQLLEQLRPVQPAMHFGQRVETLTPVLEANQLHPVAWRLRTAQGLALEARAVVIAAGIGCFQPRLPAVSGVEKYWDKQTQVAQDQAAQRTFLSQRDVVVLGQDDAALQAVRQALNAQARSVTLVFRRRAFEAEPAAVAEVEAQIGSGAVRFIAGQLVALEEEAKGALQGVRIRPSGHAGGSEADLALPADVLLVHLGLSPKLGFLADWGLTLQARALVVDAATMATNQSGIYGIGDVVTYPGKLKLLVCGFHEATLAAFAIATQLRPEQPPRLEYTTTSSRLQRLLHGGPAAQG